MQKWPRSRGTLVIDDQLAMPEPTHEANEVLHLRRGDRGDPEGLLERCDPTPDPGHEPASGQAMQGRRPGGEHDRMAQVVVGRREADRHL